jgi:hypothetical protein
MSWELFISRSWERIVYLKVMGENCLSQGHGRELFISRSLERIVYLKATSLKENLFILTEKE